MAHIIGSRVNEKDIVLSIKVGHDEALQLQGNTKDIRLFSLRTPQTRASIYERGKNGSSKYFLVPKEVRQKIKFNKEVFCQKLENKENIIWIYMMSKI